ncbi:MAG: I78 family peptidase inhibitor [Paracoccaceae bacterium]
MTIITFAKSTIVHSGIVAGMVFLGACDGPTSPYMDTVSTVPHQGGHCNSRNLQWMIGQPETAIGATEISGPIRVIRHGDAATTDHVTTRTNFRMDVDGRIAEITCG